MVSVNCQVDTINSRFIMIDIGSKYETEGMPLLHNESLLYKYQKYYFLPFLVVIQLVVVIYHFWSGSGEIKISLIR